MTIADRPSRCMRQAALSKLSLLGHHPIMASQLLWNPPWKKLVQEILQKNLEQGKKESLNFQLATIKSGPTPRPAVRTVVFRGFVGETRDESPPPELPGGNPPAESSLFLVSTDALMAKVGELEQSSGVFEVCWWHAGTNQQIRFNGTAHVYRNSPEDFPEAHLKRYIRVQGDREWSWEKERERVWTAHKPGMRGSFRNPPPGTELDDEKKKRLQVVELDSNDNGPDAQEAKDRFCLLVMEVTEIEILDLSPPPVLPRLSHVPEVC
jgi:pyridoxamine 5'-phosphate oxidase